MGEKLLHALPVKPGRKANVYPDTLASSTSLPAFLIDEPFTLPVLQQTYEVVLGRPVDKSAFRKRMLDGGFMEEAGMQPAEPGQLGRPAMTYRLRDRARAVLFPRTFNARADV